MLPHSSPFSRLRRTENLRWRIVERVNEPLSKTLSSKYADPEAKGTYEVSKTMSAWRAPSSALASAVSRVPARGMLYRGRDPVSSQLRRASSRLRSNQHTRTFESLRRGEKSGQTYRKHWTGAPSPAHSLRREASLVTGTRRPTFIADGHSIA